MSIKTGREKRKTKVRQRIKSAEKGRKLTVFRSNKHIWAQIIDIPSGRTMLSFNDKSLIKQKPELAKKNKSEKAFAVGKQIAKQAMKEGIKKVTFDRGHYSYHGRVKALAEGARAGGLNL
jgi:large subunit ribosomal protein L18